MNLKKTALFAIAVIVGGCVSVPTPSSPEEITPQPAAATQPGIYKFTIVAGVADSGWRDEGNGFSAEINTQVPAISSGIKETQNLMQNVDLLTSDRAGLAFVYDYHIVLANEGKLMSAFPDAPTEKITIKCGTEMVRPMFPEYSEPARIVLPLYEEQLHILVSVSSGITSVKELRGKHISTGEAGSATEQLARFLISGLGIDWETEISREQFDLATAMLALENGEIDALLWSGYVPHAELLDFWSALETEFVLIPITEDDADAIIQANPGVFHQSKIPAGMYSSAQEDVNTLATTVVLAAMEDFPEEYATQILAAFFGQPTASWKSRFPVTPDAAIALLGTESQSYLHRGAASYFIEAGVLR